MGDLTMPPREALYSLGMASGQLKRLSFMVDASLFDAIERARGDVARERWLRRAVERALEARRVEPGDPGGNADRAQARGQLPAPAEQPVEWSSDEEHREAARARPGTREFRPYPKGGK